MDEGLHAIWTSGNIAIIVLMIIVLMQQVLIGFLLRGILKTKDVLEKVNITMAVFSERITTHVKCD